MYIHGGSIWYYLRMVIHISNVLYLVSVAALLDGNCLYNNTSWATLYGSVLGNQ